MSCRDGCQYNAKDECLQCGCYEGEEDGQFAQLTELQERIGTMAAAQARLEAKIDRVLAAQVFAQAPCPPHDYPKIWAGRKGDAPDPGQPRVCRKCGALEPTAPPGAHLALDGWGQ